MISEMVYFNGRTVGFTLFLKKLAVVIIICLISDLDLRELKGSRLKGHELRFREFCVLTFVILQFWTARKLVPVK